MRYWPPETAYGAYDGRRETELVMRFYKDTPGLDETRAHDDHSVMGSEFVNFLASVITRRLIKRFDRASLLEGDTYGQIMRKLGRAKMARCDGGDWRLVNLSKSCTSLLERLGLVAPAEAS